MLRSGAMSSSPFHRPHPEAPAQATLHPIEPGAAWAGLDLQGFEVVSRGDFVSGVLAWSAVEAAAPLLLLIHGTGSSAAAPALDFAADWVRAGWHVARLDLPLHGQRSSPKLSARLVAGLEALDAGRALDVDTRALVEEFARQSTSDLIRCVEALTGLPRVDAHCVALMGFGVGASACAWALAHDVRPRAAVLALPTAAPQNDPLDPSPALASGKDKAQVLAILDERSSPAARHLASAGHETRTIAAEQDALPAADIAAARSFLDKAYHDWAGR